MNDYREPSNLMQMNCKLYIIRGIIVFSFAFFYNYAAKAQAYIEYSPPFIPLNFQLYQDGTVNVQLSGEIITPIGKFGIGYSRNLQRRFHDTRTIERVRFRERDILLIINDPFRDTATFYKIENGTEFTLRITGGQTELTYVNGILTLDLNNVYELYYRIGDKQNTQEFNFVEKRVVLIETNPPGADVYIDNANIPYKSPINVLLEGDINVVTIIKENYHPIRQAISILDNKKRYSFELTSSKPKLHFETNPNGAEVYIDDRFILETPGSAFLEEGDYSLRIKKTRHYDIRTKVKVYKNETLTYNLRHTDFVGLGLNYDNLLGLGFQLDFTWLWENGTFFGYGYSRNSNIDISNSIDFIFKDQQDLIYYDLTFLDASSLFQYSRRFVKIGIPIIDRVLFFSPSIGLGKEMYTFHFVSNKDQNIGNQHVSNGSIVGFLQNTERNKFLGINTTDDKYVFSPGLGLTANLFGFLKVNFDYNFHGELNNSYGLGFSVNLVNTLINY